MNRHELDELIKSATEFTLSDLHISQLNQRLEDFETESSIKCKPLPLYLSYDL